MIYVTNNGKGWYIQSSEGKLRPDGSLRHYAWNGVEWCTIMARYWDDKADADKELKLLTDGGATGPIGPLPHK